MIMIMIINRENGDDDDVTFAHDDQNETLIAQATNTEIRQCKLYQYAQCDNCDYETEARGGVCEY